MVIEFLKNVVNIGKLVLCSERYAFTGVMARGRVFQLICEKFITMKIIRLFL